MATKAKTKVNKMKEFSIVNSFKHGYRNREEITMLPPGVLVEGSQNVVTNTSGRVGIVKGYSIDGTASAVLAPIASSFDWRTSKGYERHLRAGFLTSAGNDGKLQFRYEDANGNITWKDLLTGLASAAFNFADFWDYTTEKIAKLLFVNHSAKIYEWSGAVTTVASTTSNSITKEGTTTWAEEGFYTAGTRQVTINGVDYTYTGGETTVAIIGVTPTPVGIVASDVVVQTVRSTLNSSMTGLPLPTNDLIETLLNQVYVGCLTINDVYVSKTNNYTDYSFTATRLPGEGALFNLGSTPTAFVPQGDAMYISGVDEWYQTKFQLSSDLTKESLSVQKLQTASKQSAKSQAFVTKGKNVVAFLSNEPVLSTFGPTENIFQAPQIIDLSFPIINDMNAYDFTDGSCIYWKNYYLVAVPKSSLIRIYNMTDGSNHYWEAPVTYPISRFSIINGDLYGHSYLTSESYKLFDGYNFKNNVIDARAVFSYNNYGSRFATKSFNEFYYEGRCTQNGTLNLGIQFETEGCATSVEYPMAGDSQWVCAYSKANALGKNSLGKQPLGGNIAVSQTVPPLFRKIKTMPRVSFYQESTSFSSVEKDFQWELCAFGPLAEPTTEGNNDILD